MTGGAAPRRKGSQWERDVVLYLKSRGFDAARTYGAGRPDDVGDIDLDVAAFARLLIEAKDHKTSRRGEWIDEARAKSETWAAGTIPVVVEKRPRHHAGAAFVTLDLVGLCDLIHHVARRIVYLGDLDLDVDDPGGLTA